MMKIGRETVDLDFLLTRMNAEVKGLQEVFEEIASISAEDGFTFSFEGIEILFQPHMEYSGYRTTFKVTFAKMKDIIHVDIGIGDIVEPQNRKIKLFEYRGKPFFEESISLLVYPIETIFAEKLETVLSKGSRNSSQRRRAWEAMDWQFRADNVCEHNHSHLYDFVSLPFVRVSKNRRTFVVKVFSSSLALIFFLVDSSKLAEPFISPTDFPFVPE